MKIVLIGYRGLLGQDLDATLSERPNLELIRFNSETLDIREASCIDTLVSLKADWIVNASAYTAVDAAEDDKDAAMALNALGAENLAKAAKLSGATLIHFSTDYVFDGTKDTAYLEDDVPNPLNVYGASKLAGELAIDEQCSDYYIFRIQWLYGHGKANFVNTVLKLANNEGDINMVADQFGSLSWTADIAKSIAKIIQAPIPFGTYHLASKGYANWADITRHILRQIGSNKAVHDCKTDSYPRPAKRPLNSRLNVNKLNNATGLEIGDWDSRLDAFLATLSLATNTGKNSE